MMARGLNRFLSVMRRSAPGSTPAVPVRISKQGREILQAYRVCRFVQRLQGLHAPEHLDTGHSLILEPCQCIHTFGMQRSLDLAFLARDGRIVKVETVAPNRVCGARGAYRALEMPIGTIHSLSLAIGQVLTMEACTWK